ncbi:CGNR zinc finger domain-containing protein [Kitasatospora sp. NPDC002227]|uniref:CGNR zinc finger domain-containing protein n=1 Tax=Kitasatospora sp. NPDC002227 TaxID=3154773 RepID=UPI00332E902E
MADPRDPRPLTGEPLSIDLLNTRWRSGAAAQDLLTDLAGYEIWLSSAGLAERCEVSEAALAAAREAREAVAAALGGGDAAALNAVLGRGRVRRSLGPAGPAESVEADGPQWLAAWLAADDYLALVRQGERRIKQCAGPGCVLHFLDTSQNGRRRWCSMATCGNRAKAARHYEKVTGGS